MEKTEEAEVPFRAFSSGKKQKKPSVDMNRIVGEMDILFVCLDTLRYDVAAEEEAGGGTPVLNQFGPWEKRQAPGNFTWPSHHAMFAGFFPCDYEAKNLSEREMLFFPRQIGMGGKVPEGAFGYRGSTIMEGLELLPTFPSPTTIILIYHTPPYSNKFIITQFRKGKKTFCNNGFMPFVLLICD